MRRFLIRAFAAALTLGAASPAFAQYAAADSGDTAWMLVSAMLVLLGGIGGLSLHFAARVRAGSALSTIAGVIAVAATVSLVWALIGYSIAFSPGSPWLGGGANLLLANLGDIKEGLTVPESAFLLFQMAFAVFAACLIVGAVADRVRFGWLVAFAPLWCLVVYAPIARWLWSDGFLSAHGALDYSGGLVVQGSAGVSALVAAALMGRRRASAHPPASPLIGHAGVGLLWLAYLAMAGGWALGATDDAGAALINAHLAAAGGAIGWTALERVRFGKVTASGFGFGALAGLSAAMAGAGFVGPASAILLGLIGAPLCQFAATRLSALIDDPAKVVAVNGVAGLIGALVMPILTKTSFGGVGIDGRTTISLLVSQALAVGVVALWSALGTAILGFGISMAIPMRVGEAEEAEGLDASLSAEG